MHSPSQPLAMPIDQNGFIVADRPCLQCGYNLRGLSHLGNCPECNTPASLALQGDMLRFADPSWLDTLARGCSLYLWGLLAVVCVSMAVGIASTFLGVPKLGQVGGFLGSLVMIYGLWLLTHPDPSGITEERNGKARKWVRISIVYGLCQGFLSLILMTFNLPPAAGYALILIGIAGLVMQTIGDVARFFYLKGLAERIPNPDHANRAKLIARAYLILMPLIALAFILILTVMFTNLIPGGGPGTFGLPAGFPFLPGSLTPPAAPVAPAVPPAGPSGAAFVMMISGACIVAPAALALAVFQILGFILVYKLGQAFREQSYYAHAYREMLKNPAAHFEAPPSAGADAQ